MSSNNAPEATAPTPEFAPDSALKHKVAVNREQTVQMIRNDYGVPWKGVIRETKQNSGDAWGENKEKGILPADQPLHVRMSLDTAASTLTLTDNAGGMPKSVLKDNLMAIDNTSKAKAEGKGAGSYGRGFWVIVSCGERVYAETKHGSEHWAATATAKGVRSDPYEPDTPMLSHDGTYIQVRDLNPHDVEGRLDNWEAVEECLVENFAFLLLRDDVTVEYEIDGEVYEPEVPDLHTLKEDHELRFEAELDEFSYNGESYQVRDLTVVDATEFDGEVPWRGVALLKGNDYLDDPFLTIDTYQPIHIPSLSGDDPQMFGWCDATDLCPDLEDNAHSGFQIEKDGGLQVTGIKEVLKEVHDEHFKRSQNTADKQEVMENIRQRANEILANQSEAFDGHGVKDDNAPATGDTGPDRPRHSPPSLSLVECQVGQREFDAGDAITLGLVVNVPEEPGCDAYDVYDIEVENQTTGEVYDPFDFANGFWTLDVDGHKNTPVPTVAEFTPDEDGMYVFRAKVRESPDILDPSYAKQVAVQKDKSHVYFRVGDAEPVHQPEPEGDEEGGNVTFIEDITGMPVPDLEAMPMKAATMDGAEGGFEVSINTRRPEWETTFDIPDEGDRKQAQEDLGVEWAVEAVLDYMLKDDLAAIAGDATDDDGSPLAGLLTEAFDTRRKQLGLLELALTDQ